MKLRSYLRHWFSLVLILLMVVPLAACNLEDFRVEAAQGSQLVTSVLSDPKTFNYALNQESPNIFGLTYEGLITENPITGEVEPALAESWEISDDNLRITFTLRQGLQWSDGQPLTVDDVVFTYNDIYLNEAIPTDLRDILRVGEAGALPTVEKLDDRRVQFTVPEPFAPFLRTTGLAIMPAHALRQAVTTKAADGQPQFLSTWGVDTPPNQIIVNGPYKLALYATNQRVIFRRNPYYWRQDGQGNPQPYIDRVVWQIIESTDTQLLQFRSGGLDALGVSPENFALIKRQAEQQNYTVYNGGPAAGTSFVFFNLNTGRRADGTPLVNPIKSRWFTNVKFRQAIAYAIDRQKMIDNTFRGLGQPQNSPISVQSPYYLPPEEGLKTYDHDPERARQLLREAGFQYNPRGQLLDREGNRVRFTLITNAGNETREAMGSQIKQDLSKIGIQVDFNPIAFNTIVDKLSNSLDWEATLLGLTGGIEPNDGANVWLPDGGLHMFNQSAPPGSPPIAGRQIYDWEAEIGRLYIQAAQELDETKRKALYAKTQQITQENLPLIYLVNPLSLTAVRDKFEGIQYSALGGAFWNIHEIRVED